MAGGKYWLRAYQLPEGRRDNEINKLETIQVTVAGKGK
jgi:hypothetical protein